MPFPGPLFERAASAPPVPRGLPLVIALTGFTAPKIVWVRENEPEIFQRTAHILLPKDYVRLLLTGAYVTDVSDGSGIALMDLDFDKIDDAVLALLLLGQHDGDRAWKGFDWEAMDRLHERGFISDPRSKAKSVEFSDEGLVRARQLLTKLFGKA